MILHCPSTMHEFPKPEPISTLSSLLRKAFFLSLRSNSASTPTTQTARRWGPRPAAARYGIWCDAHPALTHWAIHMPRPPALFPIASLGFPSCSQFLTVLTHPGTTRTQREISNKQLAKSESQVVGNFPE